MQGCCGQILCVDLTTREFTEQAITENDRTMILGGSGLGVKLLLDELGSKLSTLDPLAADNPLYFLAGPLAGSNLPGTSRMVICAKSPLTGIWGESNVGGNAPVYLKSLGYEGIKLTGKASEPLILELGEDGAQLLPAGELWGQDTYLVTEILQGEQTGIKKPAVLAIGQAGENLLPFAGVVHNKGHVAGRTGMGAVMGSKGLKAIVLNYKPSPKINTPLRTELINKLRENILMQALGAFGTLAVIDLGVMRGDVPIKNWAQGEWDAVEQINGESMADNILVGRKSCHGCPVGCKRQVKVATPGYEVQPGPGPEYETVGTFGTMCLIDDLNVIAKANELCNRYGLDTITCGSTISFALEAFERGLITAEECDNLDLAWGKGDVVLQLIEKIARNEGVGKRLAKGSWALAQELGPEAQKLVTTVKKLEAPMHDPRGTHGLGLAYATGYRGACHVSCRTMAVEQGAALYLGLGLDGSYEGQTSEGKAQLVTISQNLGSVIGGACIICELASNGLDEQDLCSMLRTHVGIDFSIEDILHIGERIWILKRIFNVLCGLKPEDDTLPERLLTPLESGAATGSVPDLKHMLDEFYTLRSLEHNGVPSENKLKELGLEQYLGLVQSC
ncbi:MAG TPA: aldehyde ferredoxin oxidoreductase family protein [Candidatus Deferrimicrobium sp.]|nr:aldehyde ferredoxin oxidoreductase family protein [Candidatus Deferrimicrobium sp.]